MATTELTHEDLMQVESEALMQDYKAAHLIGSNNRLLTYAQLLAV